MPLLESVSAESNFYQNNNYDWLRDETTTKYVMKITEEKSFLFCDGNLIVISNETLNESGDGGSDFTSELVKFVFGPITHVIHLFAEDATFENVTLRISMVIEVFGLIASFLPNPKIKALGK